MNLFDRLYPDVAIQIPGCPDLAIERAILYAVRRVLQMGKLWQPEIDRFPLISGVNDYVIDLPTNTRIAKMFRVFVDHVEIPPLDRIMEAKREGTIGYYIDADNTMYVGSGTPRGWVDFQCAVYPIIDDDNIDMPAALVEDYEDLFTQATLARLFSMPNTGWYNPQEASFRAATVERMMYEAQSLQRNRDAPRRRNIKYGGY